MTRKRIYLAAMLTVVAVMNALAQGNGSAGITKATDMVTGYFDPAV